MKNIQERLAAGEILVSDGAIGTLMHAKGLAPGECPETWCVTHPDILREIAAAYRSAGADLVESASFGANSFKLARYGMEGRVRELNIAAVKVAREGAPGAYVAGSVGPTGKIVEEEGGDATPSQMYEAFAEQVSALAEAAADVICIETLASLYEAREAIRAAKDHSKLPVICCMTYEQGAKGFRTMMGVKPDRAARELAAAGSDIIGANCGNGMTGMIEITRQMRAAMPDTPILINANAGLPAIESGKTIYKETPAFMASLVPALVAAGANIIGGCCGTTPEHISAMAAALRGLSAKA